jgi:hypothetical protein
MQNITHISQFKNFFIQLQLPCRAFCVLEHTDSEQNTASDIIVKVYLDKEFKQTNILVLSWPRALTEYIVIYWLYPQHTSPLIAVNQDNTTQHNLKHNRKLTAITSKHIKHKFHLHQSCCIESG